MQLAILYRGPLSNCNYGCAYCPFAKRRQTRAELADDSARLGRFVDWVQQQASRGHRISVLFTPWGEALVHRAYQEALVRLTNMPHVDKAAIQTNLSCRLDWVRRCDRSRLGLWCTYHPSQVTRQTFLAQCRRLDEFGVRYSVGMVGLREDLDEIEAMRQALRPGVYLWVNAYKRVENYYTEDDLRRLSAVDALFAMNSVRHPSLGRPCRAGHSVISVDGDGVIRRCHFIRAPLGNIYEPDWERALHSAPSACTNDTCGCHIGYVHMPELRLYEIFGDGVLERIPVRIPPRAAAQTQAHTVVHATLSSP